MGQIADSGGGPVAEERSWADPASAGAPPATRAENRRPGKWRTRGRIGWAFWLCITVVFPASKLMFAIRYRHGERFPRQGPVLLVANHVSILDPLACAGWCSTTAGCRTSWPRSRCSRAWPARSCARPARSRSPGTPPTRSGALSAAQDDLAAGNVVVIYPEGSVTRDPNWWPMEARTGAARLALTTDAVVCRSPSGARSGCTTTTPRSCTSGCAHRPSTSSASRSTCPGSVPRCGPDGR